MIIEGIGPIMDEVCSKCEQFTQVSISSGTHLWGDCRKPASGIMEQINGQREAVFKWGGATCSDFKPRQEAQDEAG